MKAYWPNAITLDGERLFTQGPATTREKCLEQFDIWHDHYKYDFRIAWIESDGEKEYIDYGGGDILEFQDYTIRTTTNGAVVCTGVSARCEEEAEERFLSMPTSWAYSEDDIYAAPSRWND